MKNRIPLDDLIVEAPKAIVTNFVFNTSVPITVQQKRDLKAFFTDDNDEPNSTISG